MSEAAFLITVDTEGDDMWSRNSGVTTENAKFLPRFQTLCEQFGFKPTYLTNYEMAISKPFQEFAKDVIERGVGEIGMHLHAWHSPPEFDLTGRDYETHPFLTDYPEHIARQKVEYMTKLLQDTFNCPIVSHRAGRWAFDETYARLLDENDYLVDCSVTPNQTWQFLRGGIPGKGGPDFRGFPESPYFMSLDAIKCDGDSNLLQIPMTAYVKRPYVHRLLGKGLSDTRIGRKILKTVAPVCAFRPGREMQTNSLLWIVERAITQNRPYLEFMLHSSELMPGGSPRFPNEDAIERLYDVLETTFASSQKAFRGQTLNDYRVAWIDSRHAD